MMRDIGSPAPCLLVSLSPCQWSAFGGRSFVVRRSSFVGSRLRPSCSSCSSWLDYWLMYAAVHQWQREAELRAALRAVLGPDLAAVGLDDPFADRQSQPG